VDERDDRAKQPVSAALAGPYGHPFHPILVTVPIGAWVCSLVFDIASLMADPPEAFGTGARWLIGIGIVGALAAATVGFLDFFAIPAGTPAHRTARTHMLLNLAITVGFAVDLAWRLGADDTVAGAGPLALSVVCLAALGISGSLGGKLAYRYGVRVVADSVQSDGFVGQQTGSSPARPSPSTRHQGE
jgi:uncharacterized membrane protein